MNDFHSLHVLKEETILVHHFYCKFTLMCTVWNKNYLTGLRPTH